MARRNGFQNLRTLCAKRDIARFSSDFQVLDVPGHTSGHIAFYTPDMDVKPIRCFAAIRFFRRLYACLSGARHKMLASLDKLAFCAKQHPRVLHA